MKLTIVLVAVGETHSKLYGDDQKEKGRVSNSPWVAFPEPSVRVLAGIL